MKNKFFGMAAVPLLALLATGCTQETVETNTTSDGATLGYGVATGKHTLSTRAAEAKIATLQEDGLTVLAYKESDGAYFETFDLEYFAAGQTPFGQWVYDGGAAMLHPAFNLNHFSVYPALEIAPGGEAEDNFASGAGNVVFDYTVAASQADLLAAAAKTTNASADDATAKLTYKHLLSQINFAVKGLTGYLITVSDLKVNGVRNKGKATIAIDGASAVTTSWAVNNTSTSNYSYGYSPVANTPSTDGLTDDLVYLTTDGKAPSAIDSANENGLMLMPQTLDAGSFSFNYEIGYTNEYDNSGDYVKVDSGTVTVPLNLTGLTTTTWAAGNRYLYVINFETPIFISYTVNVDTWAEGSTSNVDVDNNDNGQDGEVIPDDTNETEVVPSKPVVTP